MALIRLRKCEYRSDSRDGRSMERVNLSYDLSVLAPDLVYHAILSLRGIS